MSPDREAAFRDRPCREWDKEHTVVTSDTEPPAPMSALAVLKTSSKVSFFLAAAGEVVHVVDGLALFVHPASAAPQAVALEAVADACRTTGAAFAT